MKKGYKIQYGEDGEMKEGVDWSDSSTLYFYWYGFFNNQTRKREFTECEFQQESNKKYEDNHVILIRCDL